jgi:hypothetical protein
LTSHTQIRWNHFQRITNSLVTILFIALAVVSLACQPAPTADRQPPLMRVAYTSAVDIGDLPSLIAHRQLEKAGYRVEETFYAQPELAVEALASGGADVASGGTRAFWAAAVKGAELRLIMKHSENGYQLAAVPGVTTCRDLHGRTLALSSQGALPTALVQAFLQRCQNTTPQHLDEVRDRRPECEYRQLKRVKCGPVIERLEQRKRPSEHHGRQQSRQTMPVGHRDAGHDADSAPESERSKPRCGSGHERVGPAVHGLGRASRSRRIHDEARILKNCAKPPITVGEAADRPL